MSDPPCQVHRSTTRIAYTYKYTLSQNGRETSRAPATFTKGDEKGKYDWKVIQNVIQKLVIVYEL